MTQLSLFMPTTGWVSPQSLPDLRGEPLVAVDIETRDKGIKAGLGPGWVWLDGFTTGIAVAWGVDKQIYIPVRHPETSCFESPTIKKWLKELFQQDETKFIFHNASYDLGWLTSEFGCSVPRQLEDTAAMAAIVDENKFSYKLDDLCGDYGIDGKSEDLLKEATAAYGLKDAKGEMWKLPAKFVGPYAEQDARATLELYKKLLPILEQEGTEKAYRLECDLIPMIMAMRKRGIRVDVKRAEQAVGHFAKERDTVLSEISRNLGRATSMEAIRSPGWLVEAFTEEGIPFPRTEKGNPSFGADWMSKSEHWLPKLITRTKKLEDASSKFFQNYILDFSKKGRVHPNIHQFRSEDGGTRSHRFSYSAPPLQQAPSRNGEFANVFRGVFLPEPGEVWAAIDYSQQEFRLLVHYAELLNLPKAKEAGDKYREDAATDFHSLVAELTGLPRKKAKDVNFAAAYGAGIAQLANMSGMTLDEATEVRKQYDQRMPFIKELGDSCGRRAAQTGQIKMIDGAVSHFDLYECAEFGVKGLPATRAVAVRKTETPGDPWYGKRLRRAYTHKACNRLIQGSAARQTKKAMLECYKAGVMPSLTIHDELDFSVKTKKEAELAADIMVNALKFTIPMKCDVEFGISWADSMRGRSWEEVYAERS